MNKSVLILSIFLLSMFNYDSNAQEEANLASMGPRKRIAVIKFVNKTSFADHDIGRGVADMLTTALWKTDRFVVVERSELERVIAEQDLSRTGMVSSETAARAGRILGLNAIVLGGITEFGYVGGATRIGVDLRLVDVNTAHIILAENAIGTSSGKSTDQAARQAVDNLAVRINSSLQARPWEGQVMESSDNQVYINAGSKVGIRKGDTFVILRPGKELIDPVTGKVLGTIEKKIGRVEIITVEEEFSLAGALDGGSFRRNDLVREVKSK